MPALMGLDPEELLALAAHLQVTAGQVGALGSELRNRMAQTAWRGPDADRCMKDFEDVHRPALMAFVSFLEDNAQLIRRTVEDQQQASAR